MEAPNPAIKAFAEQIRGSLVWGEVLIEERPGGGYSIRNERDRAADLKSLRLVAPGELRKLSMFNEAGQFRPIKAAPDLVAGWTANCSGLEELWQALQQLYPGSIGDWFAAQGPNPPVTGYRAFTNRQTGMYRITQLLTNEQVADVISAACHPRFCMKRRLWSLEGLPTDPLETKSAIPCLEPCAVLLELARKAARIEQEQPLDIKIPPTDLRSAIGALEKAIGSGKSEGRIGDTASDTNPRRLQLLLAKLARKLDGKDKSQS